MATDVVLGEEPTPIAQPVQGGRERGLILHKILEEVLTGEIPETTLALVARAEALIRQLGRSVADDPAQGLAPGRDRQLRETRSCASEIAALRPRLTPEFTVYASILTEEREEASTGVADAIAFGTDGAPQVVVDWKSDVKPASETLEHYRAQVRAYLRYDRDRARAHRVGDIGDRHSGHALGVADRGFLRPYECSFDLSSAAEPRPVLNGLICEALLGHWPSRSGRCATRQFENSRIGGQPPHSAHQPPTRPERLRHRASPQLSLPRVRRQSPIPSRINPSRED